MKDVLSTREVAGVLGVSEARALTDYRGSAGGRPVVRNTVKVGAKWYWPTEEVRAFLHRRQEETTKALHRLSVAAGTSWADEKVMAETPDLTAVTTPVKWVSVGPIFTDEDGRKCYCFPEFSGTYLVTRKGKPNYVEVDEYDECDDTWPWENSEEDDLLAWAELPAAFEEAA